MNDNILNYVLDSGKNIALKPEERKMLVSLFQMLIKSLEQMKKSPFVIDTYIQACYSAIEKVQNDGKEEKESAENANEKA